jgi:flagellar biosynthesis/type III secretory pathway protein FliH
MNYYVSEDPDTLGAKVQSTDPESAVALALDQGRVAGTEWTVRWDLKPDNAKYVFARVTTITGDPRPGASGGPDSQVPDESAAAAEAKAKAKAEAEAKAKAEAEAKAKAAEEAKAKAEAEAKAKAEEEAKAKAKAGPKSSET